jgi:ParB family chromosome partitioning protein
MNDIHKRRLGRGLDALLPTGPASVETSRAKIEELHPNRNQPRTRFDDQALAELAQSIKDIGVLEPILVRHRAQGGYEIVAGERRWRAAQRAGLHEVPIYVRELAEGRAFEAALVENLQREDLNPLETARAFSRLVDEHGHIQDSLAQLIGKDRSTVANALRLLKLPEPVMDLIESRELSEGHGRALLGAGDAAAIQRLAREAISAGWSVRETERRARVAAQEKPKTEAAAKSPNTRDLEERLSRSVGARVSVADRKGKGHLQIAFSSYDELDRLIAVLERR